MPVAKQCALVLIRDRDAVYDLLKQDVDNDAVIQLLCTRDAATTQIASPQHSRVALPPFLAGAGAVFWSGSGSYSYSYSTVNILFSLDPKYDYKYD